IETQGNTVAWSSVRRPSYGTVGHGRFVEAKRLVKRYRMSRCAAGTFGRNDNDISDGIKSLFEGADTRGVDAVVVGQKDSHDEFIIPLGGMAEERISPAVPSNLLVLRI